MNVKLDKRDVALIITELILSDNADAHKVIDKLLRQLRDESQAHVNEADVHFAYRHVCGM